MELKQKNSQLVQKLASVDNLDFEAANVASTKDAALKKAAEDNEKLESSVSISFISMSMMMMMMMISYLDQEKPRSNRKLHSQ